MGGHYRVTQCCKLDANGLTQATHATGHHCYARLCVQLQCPPLPAPSLGRAFDGKCRAHPPADTQARKALAGPATHHLMQQRDQDAAT